MSIVNELVDGTQSQMLTETIDNDTLYNIKDMRPIIPLTNAQMVIPTDSTVTPVSKGLVKLNDIALCLDSGTYLQYHLYKYVGYVWAHIGQLQFSAIPEIVTTVSSSSTNAQVVGAKAVYDNLQLKENVANKSTTLSSSSTTTQYPTSKTVYDYTNANFAPTSAIEIRSV